MTKELLIIINNNIELGKALNAIGHMMVGIGPRIPGGHTPSIRVFSTSSENVRALRAAAINAHNEYGVDSFIYSDFAHTTTDGCAKDHEKNTKIIEEKDINYFAVCVCADVDKLQSCKITTKCQQYDELKLSDQGTISAEFEFESEITYSENPDFVENDEKKRFSAVVQRNLSAADTLVATAIVYLNLSSTLSREELRLHAYLDSSGTIHPGMSEYGLVVLKPKKNSVLNTILRAEISDTVTRIVYSNSSVAFFGDSEEIKSLTKKNLSLWTGKLSPADFKSSVSTNQYSLYGSTTDGTPSDKLEKSYRISNK